LAGFVSPLRARRVVDRGGSFATTMRGTVWALQIERLQA
jgi:hypothetical protein